VSVPTAAIHPEAPGAEIEEFQIARRDEAGSELVIRGDVYRTAGAQSGVIFCHGFKGFGRWGFYPYLAPHVAAAGFNVVTFDFSGSGVGEDRERYTQPEAFATNTYSREQADIASVVQEARSRGWIAERYGVFGHSRGGGGAILHSADNPGVAALVTWAAVSRVLRWSPGAAEEWRTRGYTEIVNARTGDVLRLNCTLLEECELLAETTLNIRAAAAKITAPWLIVHGSGDETVPTDDSHALYAAAGGAAADNVTLHVVQGGNHVFGASHPLRAVPEMLRDVVRRTADFFAGHVR
jgi:dipeptidyl aminopeptidase/acylaminoacyl peptidase